MTIQPFGILTWDDIRFGLQDHDQMISFYHSYSDSFPLESLQLEPIS